MIKELITEKGHDERLDKLTPIQQGQYNNIINDIKTEEDEYIVAVDLADSNFRDYSVVCKGKIENGKFCVKEFKYVK